MKAGQLKTKRSCG